MVYELRRGINFFLKNKGGYEKFSGQSFKKHRDVGAAFLHVYFYLNLRYREGCRRRNCCDSDIDETPDGGSQCSPFEIQSRSGSLCFSYSSVFNFQL